MRNYPFIIVAALCSMAAGAIGSQDVHFMTIDAQGDSGKISRHIYGHFAEHLGRGIYDGIWTENDQGQFSPNEDVFEALKELGIPNLRWPGGCFADYYFWKDGIGPLEERPSVVNNLWGGVTENNAVGTHEFLNLTEELGAEPIVVGNVGSGTVQEMAEWWQYINHAGISPMAKLRRENGRETPWNVRFWGVGNESWGCGGHMTPDYYADLYRRFSTFLHPYPNVRPFRIATGAAGGDFNWTEVVMQRAGNRIDGIDLHHYTLDGSWTTHKGQAVDFDEGGWFRLMSRALEMDKLLIGHTAVMDKYDPEKRVWLIVGEWGTWHEQEEGSVPGFLYQQNTLRDALTAALTLDIFHQHLDRVKMANIAQTVNVLQAMILTKGDRMLRTPTYHTFDLYKPHREATALPFFLDRGHYRYEGEEGTLPALSATASRHGEGLLNLSLTNIDPHRSRTVEVTVQGKNLTRIQTARILTAPEMNTHNTFDEPNRLVPQPFRGAALDGALLRVTLPAKSLVTLQLE